MRAKLVSATEIFERFIERTNGQRQLTSAQKAARGEVCMPKPLGEFCKDHVARCTVGIKNCHALVAGQSFDAALLFEEQLCGGAKLLESLWNAILLLQQSR